MLKLWTMPRHYAGASWPDWYVFLSQSRDSDCLKRSNFACGLKQVTAKMDKSLDCEGMPSVMVIRESHWAVGWVEWIGIHKSDIAALAEANAIADKLEDYPVWVNCLSLKERVELCQEAGISIFAARHDYAPDDDRGLILDRLTR